MLIGDPLGEGSNASSTISELWRLRSGAQGTNRGLTGSNKGTKVQRVTLPLRDFRKKAEHSMC